MVGSIIRKPEKSVSEMLYAIRDSLSNLACSDNEEDADDKEVDKEDIEFGKLS